MLKKTFYVMVTPKKTLNTDKMELLKVKATTQTNALNIIGEQYTTPDAKVYSTDEVIDYGAKWLEQELLKDKPINLDAIINIENDYFDVDFIREKLNIMDNKRLSKFIVFLAVHNLKLQREIGFEVDSATSDYQKATLNLFTKLADCLDMVDEVFDEDKDCKHHIESLLDYFKYIMLCKELPIFKNVRYLINTHFKVILKGIN